MPPPWFRPGAGGRLGEKTTGCVRHIVIRSWRPTCHMRGADVGATKRRATGKRRSAKPKKKAKPARRARAPRRNAADKINFAPNDLRVVGDLPIRVVTPHPDRPRGRADFAFPAPAPALAQHQSGTQAFLYWQCREAVLRALAAFESATGAPVVAWAPQVPNPLPVIPNAGVKLNAFYNRLSLSFFQHATGTNVTMSGASTDVVAHELGHALLDSIRPSLFHSALPEHSAFHESFGDCVALLTALDDADTRDALLSASPTLASVNFAEAILESLAHGVRLALGPTHPSSEPRHAFNVFKWQLPELLPVSGTPDVLSRQSHSLSRVFTGCFYDTIRFMFASARRKTSGQLATAARTAGRLLVEGARNANLDVRLFQSVGQAMVRADDALNGGRNVDAIRQAFLEHAISLGSHGAVQERSLLRGHLAAGGAGALSLDAQSDLLTRIGADAAATANVSVRDAEFVGRRAVQVRVQRDVPLDDIDPRLAGAVAVAPEGVLVGSMADERAAVLGALPEPTATAAEVRTFVETLLAHGAIAMNERGGFGALADSPVMTANADLGVGATARPPVRRVRIPSNAAATDPVDVVTHALRDEDGRKVLRRIGFACGPGCTHHSGQPVAQIAEKRSRTRRGTPSSSRSI